jgi:hypothetical protein
MLGALANTVKATGGEGKDMVPETPPLSMIMFGLGLRSGHHPSLDQLISSQLNQIGRPFVVGARRAGALSGDVGIWSWGRGGGFSGTPGFSAFQNIQHFSINGAPANSFYQFAIYQPSVYPSGSPTFVANPLPMSGGTPP